MAKFLGVIGHPIEHSLSPVMHRAALSELGLPHSYDRFDVKPRQLEKFLGDAREEFLGLNVTIPHKVHVMDSLDSLSREAELIGAVNTVKFDNNATGFNTDGIGALRALEESGESVKGRSILVLGAGGAARAISFQLAMEGSMISICNRSRERARELAGELKDKLDREVEIIDFPLTKRLDGFDILVNATSVGMSPGSESPLLPKSLHSSLTVMDVVYNPLETRLLREAKETGCKTINGAGMLVHQGAESLRIWLGAEPPVEVMRKALLAALNG